MGIADRLKSSEICRQLVTLSAGTTLAQVLPLLFYPILSRMFLPEDFGLLATISSVVSVVAAISSGKYEQAILISRTKVDVAGLVLLASGLSFFFCIFCFPVFFLLNGSVILLLHEPRLKYWIYCVPVLSFSIVVYNCYNEWCVKKSFFTKLSVNKITNSNLGILSKIVLGGLKVKNGLIHGEVIGRVLTSLVCIVRFYIHDKNSFRLVTWEKIKRLSKEYVKFPKFTLPDQIVGTVAWAMPVWFISAFFGPKNLGYFSMMQNVLAIPMSFVGKAVMDVFRKKASVEVEKYGNCRKFFLKALKYLICISAIAVTLFIIPLPYLFKFFLGEKWLISGKLAQLYTVAAAIGFICDALSGIWIVKVKLKERLLWQVYYFFIVLVSLLLGCLVFRDLKFTVIILSIGLSSAYVISIYYSWRYSL